MGLWKEKYLATKSFPLGVLWMQKWTFWVLSCIFSPILKCRHIFVHLLVWGEWVTPYWLHCLPSPAAHQQQGQILPTGQQKEERQLEPRSFLSSPLLRPPRTRLNLGTHGKSQGDTAEWQHTSPKKQQHDTGWQWPPGAPALGKAHMECL